MRAKLINENINFKRGKTAEEVKSILFDGPPFQPGDIVWDQMERGLMERGQGKVYLYLGDNRFFGFAIVYSDIHQIHKPIRVSSYTSPWVDKFSLWEQEKIRNMRILPSKWQEKIKPLLQRILNHPKFRGQIYTKIKPNWRISESVSFQRGKSEREIKTVLFGYRLGQMVTPKHENSEITRSIGVITELYNTHRGPRAGQSAQLVSLGYIFTPPKKDPYFEGMSGYAGTSSNTDNFRPLNDEEMRLVSEYLKDPKNEPWLRAKKRDIKMKVGESIPIIYESIDFKRGKNSDDIRRDLRGGQWIPGEIKIRERQPFGRDNRELVIWLEDTDNIMPIKIYPFGSIQEREGNKYATFIHNTVEGSGIYYTREGALRNPSQEERNLIKQALESGKYDRYIDIVKERTGVIPFV